MSSISTISILPEQRDGGSSPDEKCDEFAGRETADDGRLRIKSWRFWIAFCVLVLCAFLSSIDATILATALPSITSELDGTTILAFWCATSFLLSKTVVQPRFTPPPPPPQTLLIQTVWGNMSEIFGRKNTLLVIIVVFLIGSILCARSVSMVMLVASRALQGVGGGGLITLVEVTITDLVPLAERGAYLGIVGLSWAVGTVIGRYIISCSILTLSTNYWRGMCRGWSMAMVNPNLNVLIIGSSI